jgi:hypothetical protein
MIAIRAAAAAFDSDVAAQREIYVECADGSMSFP